MSKLLTTCVSVGSLTAVTIQRISTHCLEGADVLAPVVKKTYHDSLYCCGRYVFQIPTRGESMSRPEQNAAVNNGIIFLFNNDKENSECLNLEKRVKSQPS